MNRMRVFSRCADSAVLGKVVGTMPMRKLVYLSFAEGSPFSDTLCSARYLPSSRVGLRARPPWRVHPKKLLSSALLHITLLTYCRRMSSSRRTSRGDARVKVDRNSGVFSIQFPMKRLPAFFVRRDGAFPSEHRCSILDQRSSSPCRWGQSPVSPFELLKRIQTLLRWASRTSFHDDGVFREYAERAGLKVLRQVVIDGALALGPMPLVSLASDVMFRHLGEQDFPRNEHLVEHSR